MKVHVHEDNFKGNRYNFRESNTLSKLCLTPSEKWIYSIKNLFLGSKFFLFRVDSFFQNVFGTGQQTGCHKSKKWWKIYEVYFSFTLNVDNLNSVNSC